MKANEDKLLEKLMDNVMKDSKLETPSLDFTTKVMSQVLTIKKSEVYVYKPLIPKYVFILAIGCFVTMMYYLEPQPNSWISSLSNNMYYKYFTTSQFNFSEATVYSVVSITLLLFAQIVLLKKYFDNQLNN